MGSSDTMAKAMKAMKAMAAMKAMKAMKKKAVSKIAKGRFAKVVVFRGSKAKTSGGLTSSDLIKNSRGKIVSKKHPNGPRRTTTSRAGLLPSRRPGRLWPEGFCRNQEGLSSLREGQGTLPVSIQCHDHGKASARGVGMSTPLSAVALHCLLSYEYH